MSTSPAPAHHADPRPAGPPRLIGRDDVLADLLEPAPLTVLRGESGIGRSAVLAELGDRLETRGHRVLRLQAGEHDRTAPFGALYRLLSSVDEPEAEATRSSVLGLVAKLSATPRAATAPAGARQLAVAVLTAIRRHLPLTVLIDDAHRLDDATAAVLEPLVHRIAGQACTIVLTTPPSPQRDTTPALQRLRDAGLARTTTLRPLNRKQSRQFIAEALRANPDPELVDSLHHAARGRPAALLAGITGYREAGALHTIDRHAYLGPARHRPTGDPRHPLLAPIRDAGPDAPAIARAMSLLAPLGAVAPRIAAEATGTSTDDVHRALDELVRHRVLHTTGNGWRYRTPMLRAAVEHCLGPYERRNLAAHAVTATWDGTAHPDDPHYLPDRLIDAGPHIDPHRAGRELLDHGTRALFDDPARAARLLRAAADTTTDPTTRATALLAHASACSLHGHLSDAAPSTRALLTEHPDQIPPAQLHKAVLAHIAATAGTGDHTTLQRIADGDETLPGGTAQNLIARAYAHGWLGHWNRGHQLLDTHPWDDEDPVLRDHATIYRTSIAVMHGTTEPLHAHIRETRHPTPHPEHHFDTTRHQADLLLALGELQPAEQHLHHHGIHPHQLAHTDRFLIEYMRGHWTRALHTARRAMTTDQHRTRPLSWAMLHLAAARIHIDNGQLSRARHLIHTGRTGPLPHLFDYAEAQTHRALGEHHEADQHLHNGLRTAEHHGHTLGTEAIHAELAHRAHTNGDTATAEHHLHQLEQRTEQLRTGRARLHLLLTRTHVLGDHNAAREALHLTHQRGQPRETTTVLTRLARSGHHTTRLLADAYHHAGTLDALLLRSRLRRTMRHHNVPIPNRAATTSENERLLAVLVTEGLTNRQLAAVFGTTEKSVEGRMTRMFARIGYRSRVELAAAMVTGEYPG